MANEKIIVTTDTTGVLPSSVLPKVGSARTGFWADCIATIAANQNAFYHRVFIPTDITITKIHFWVSTLSGTPVIEAGVYNNTGIAKLISQTITVSNTGLQTITVSPTTLTGGQFCWFAFVNQTAANTSTFRTRTLGATDSTISRQQTGTSSLPASVPVGTASSTFIWMEVSS